MSKTKPRCSEDKGAPGARRGVSKYLIHKQLLDTIPKHHAHAEANEFKLGNCRERYDFHVVSS